MGTPSLGSILLASTDPDGLRDWYITAFGVTPDADGFLHFGNVAVLIDRRDDVDDANNEPARIILNFHVDDARALAEHLDWMAVPWITELEWRGHAWFATLLDPDANCIQIIELSDAYYEARGLESPRRAPTLQGTHARRPGLGGAPRPDLASTRH